MVVVALVVLVRGVLSGVGSASALRLSIGSEADSWWTGFGALWFCVGAVWELCLRLCVFVLHACILFIFVFVICVSLSMEWLWLFWCDCGLLIWYLLEVWYWVFCTDGT